MFKHTENAREKAVCFDGPWHYTADTKTPKEFKTKTTDYERHRVRVALCATADGNKSIPYIFHNRKTVPENLSVCAQQIRRMTVDLMEGSVQSVS
jgi:hypothetical protein